MSEWIDGFCTAFNLDPSVITLNTFVDQIGGVWGTFNKWQQEKITKHLLGEKQ